MHLNRSEHSRTVRSAFNTVNEEQGERLAQQIYFSEQRKHSRWSAIKLIKRGLF